MESVHNAKVTPLQFSPTNTIWPPFLLGGLVQEGILVQPVGNEAVKGTRLHGHTIHSSECSVCDVESIQHSDT